MRSVLGTLGYLARQNRPDLSGPVSILQRRLSGAQLSDIQETNRVVRLAKAHTDLTQPVCRIPVESNLFGILRGCQWWRHTYRTSASQVRDRVCGRVIAGRTGSSCDPGILEISHGAGADLLPA